jgi:hypothetical protein
MIPLNFPNKHTGSTVQVLPEIYYGTSKTQMILSHHDSEEDSTDVPNIFKQCMCFYKVSNSVCVSIRFQTVYVFL